MVIMNRQAFTFFQLVKTNKDRWVFLAWFQQGYIEDIFCLCSFHINNLRSQRYILSGNKSI